MEFKIAKLKALQYKTALALVIIRNKPENLKLEDFLKLLQAKFVHTFQRQGDEIKILKLKLLESNKEIFELKNNNNNNLFTTPSTTDSDSRSSVEPKNKSNPYFLHEEITKNTDPIKMSQMLKSFCSNIEFVANLVKLKEVERNFKLNKIDQELILDWLKIFLEQLHGFFFQMNFEGDETIDQSRILKDITNCYENVQNSFQAKSSIPVLSFPIESILHGVQVFLNIYQIEWLYYLRNKLIDSIVPFIDDIVDFMIHNDSNNKLNSAKSACGSQILITLSTSDYLLNSVIQSIVKNLQNVVDYLNDIYSQKTQKTVAAQIHVHSANAAGEKTLEPNKIETISNNCVQLCQCIHSIVTIRLLDNYTPLSDQVKIDLNKLLNSIFINLTNSYPFIAIELSKLIQLLAMNYENKNVST